MKTTRTKRNGDPITGTFYRIYYQHAPGYTEQAFATDRDAFKYAHESVDSGLVRIDKLINGAWHSHQPGDLDNNGKWVPVAQQAPAHCLRWTNERPVTVGWYWRRERTRSWVDVDVVDVDVVKVRDYAGQLAIGNSFLTDYREDEIEWAGPIPQPE